MHTKSLFALMGVAASLCWSLSAAEPTGNEQGECRMSRGIKFPWWRLVPGELIVGGRRLDGEAAPARLT